jgi:hypothetical protein
LSQFLADALLMIEQIIPMLFVEVLSVQIIIINKLKLCSMFSSSLNAILSIAITYEPKKIVVA